jgi:hypothetical protein
MARLIAIAVVLALHGAATVAAFRLYDSVADWTTGGYWVSPAVRVPLVIVAVVIAEMLVLASCPACIRALSRLCGCFENSHAESRHRNIATSVR